MTGHDITTRKNMEIERQKIVADLINRNRDLREFAQIVSHNLRGPLATMLGLTNMLKDSITEDEKDFVLEGVGMSAEKLDDVVMEMNNILNVKSESSETRAIVDLAGLIEEIKEKFSDIIIRSKAEIDCDFSADGEIYTMRSFIYNIFYNLISNSLKYRHENRTPGIRIWSEKKNNEMILGIADNGTGIDLEKYGDQIFLLNKRFHNTADGKGLGLFIVKAQVDVLNGTIEIDSTPGTGTTIRVILPV